MKFSKLYGFFMSNNNLNKKNFYLITTVFGISFMILNILTIPFYPLSWVDEVMFTDPALNFYQTGKFFDFTWQYGPVYPPLYQFVLVLWMKVFGFGMIEVRSLNIVIAFINSLLFLGLLQRLNFLKSKGTLIVALVIFWGSNLLSWMMRNGRVDMFSMFVLLLLALAFVTYIQKSKFTFAILAAVMAPIAGLQILPFIVFTLLFAWVFIAGSRKKVFIFTTIAGIGIVAGIGLMLLFFFNIGHLDSFLANTFTYTETFRKFLGDLPVDMTMTGVANTEVRSFMDRLNEAYFRNKEILLFLLLSFSFLVYLLKTKRINLKSIEVGFFLYVFLIPFIMTMAGRLMYYYTWMGHLSALALTIYLVDKHETAWIKKVFIVAGVFIFMSYPYNFKRFNLRESNKNIAQLIERQDIKKDDRVLATMCTFYSIREKTDQAYFYTFSLFNPSKPLIKLKHERISSDILKGMNYVICAANDRGAKIIMNQVDSLRQMGKRVTVIDSISKPDVKVFKVE